MHDAQAGFHMPRIDSCRAWLNESPMTQLFRINFLRVVTSDRNHCVVMSMDTHLANGDKTILALQLVKLSCSLCRIGKFIIAFTTGGAGALLYGNLHS